MPLGPSSTSLDGKVALVTGAAAGIGEAIALALARFGADIAVCDRDAEGLAATADAVTSQGRRCVSEALDVRDADAVEGFVEQVVGEFERVDVLVNNAAGTFRADFLDLSPNAQDSLVDENFTQVTHLVRACVPLMPPGGSIVNLTSIEAHRAGPGFAVYSAMKAAVANLTKSLALELGDRGIRVNCVAPDLISTPGVGDLSGPGARTALGRAGTPDDVAGAVVFLVGDLSAYVSGSTVHVDGGTRAAGGWRRGAGGFEL